MHIQLHSGTTDDSTTDLAFSVLADESRRLVVEALFGHETPMSVTDLAAAVVRRHPEAPSGRSETGLAIALHHAHLPKLDDADLVDYDPRSRTVTGVRTEPLRPSRSAEH